MGRPVGVDPVALRRRTRGSLIPLSPLTAADAVANISSLGDDYSDEDEDDDTILLLLTGLSAKDLVDTGSRCAPCAGRRVRVTILWSSRWDPQDPSLRFVLGSQSFATAR
jgi:hypothetical protein